MVIALSIAAAYDDHWH